MQKTYSYIVWFLFEFHIPTRLSVYIIWGDHIGPILGNTLKNVHVNKGARKKTCILRGEVKKTYQLRTCS